MIPGAVLLIAGAYGLFALRQKGGTPAPAP
jgi:hypothetical protein